VSSLNEHHDLGLRRIVAGPGRQGGDPHLVFGGQRQVPLGGAGEQGDKAAAGGIAEHSVAVGWPFPFSC
jgi:hypothetical protein